MPLDVKVFEKVVDKQNPNLAAILDGITEGIIEGIQEGVSDGLRKGFKEGLKDSISVGFTDASEFDFGKLLEEVLEDTTRTSINEVFKNVASKPAEIYMRAICDHIVTEVTKRNIELTDNDIGQIEDMVVNAEQRIVKTLSGKLPDNPFIKEIADGIQIALQDSLQKELTSCRERLEKMRSDR
jgi:hypothetical protein